MKSNSDNQVAMVLTGSVIQSYRRLEKTGLQNPRERLMDYLCAIRRWINQSEIDQVIYCDAGGFMIPEHVMENDKFQSYAVDLRSVALNRGKGPAECQTLEYLMKHCENLPRNFFKCTGRLFVENFREIFDRLDRTSHLMGMNRDSHYADTRFYWLNRSYYRPFIRPYLEEINDYTGWHVEFFYAKHCLESQLMPEPVFVGRFGHDGRGYHHDFSEEEKQWAKERIDRDRLMVPTMIEKRV